MSVVVKVPARASHSESVYMRGTVDKRWRGKIISNGLGDQFRTVDGQFRTVGDLF